MKMFHVSIGVLRLLLLLLVLLVKSWGPDLAAFFDYRIFSFRFVV